MKLKDIFIGKPLHWLLWIPIIGVLWWMGNDSQHVRDFVPFVLKLLLLTVLCIAVVIGTYRRGERITREPFEEDEI